MTGHTFIVMASPTLFFWCSPAAYASFLLFHNQISVHIAAKAAKWKKEQAQSMRLWLNDCFYACWRILHLSLEYCPGLEDEWSVWKHLDFWLGLVVKLVGDLFSVATCPLVAQCVTCSPGGVFLWPQWESPASALPLTASWSGCWCETRDRDQDLISGEFILFSKSLHIDFEYLQLHLYMW